MEITSDLGGYQVHDKAFLLCLLRGLQFFFNPWGKYIDGNLELCPIELPGRGKRVSENLLSSMEEVVDDAYRSMKKHLDGSRYMLFGHGMGGLIAYELASRIKFHGEKEPSHIFIAGKSAPHINRYKRQNSMNDDEIRAFMRAWPGIAKDREPVDEFMPIVRQDLMILQNYRHTYRDKLNTEITVLCGREEDMTVGDLIQWSQYTKKACEVYLLDGNHFFINDNLSKVIDVINQKIKIFEKVVGN